MGRGNDQAIQGAKSAVNYSGTLQNQQGSLYGALAPQLMGDISHPTGFTPNEKAEQNTAAQESAGGSEAGAVGQGALLSQRTRNSGTADAAIGESARNAGRGSMRAALGTELADTALKNQKMAAAKGELGGLYGTSTQGGNQALGQVASNVNANTQAANQSWDWAKYILDPVMGAGSQLGAAKILA